jgi:superfamily I DNA and/or RNA helicase
MRKSFDALERFFPIWITTNQSINNFLPLQDGLFDLVVIDEAGQCDI